MNKWIETYFRLAQQLSHMPFGQNGYCAAWNELEDRVLSLSRYQQDDLWKACLTTKYQDGAMVILAMLPLELGSQDEINNTP